MSIFDEQLLARQHPDRILLRVLNRQGEEITKNVKIRVFLDEPDVFGFIADKHPFLVAGNKGWCLKRQILYRKPAALIIVALAAVALFQTIYTVQIAEVWFWVPKRSDLVAYIEGGMFLLASYFILTDSRTTYIYIREDLSPFYLPIDANYTITDFLRPLKPKKIRIYEEVIKNARKRGDIAKTAKLPNEPEREIAPI